MWNTIKCNHLILFLCISMPAHSGHYLGQLTWLEARDAFASTPVVIMEFARGHSIGLLYGRTGAGWLLSPQYRDNEEQIELRWSWRPTPDLVIDARVRRRKELDRLVTATQRVEELDVFVRATWRLADVRLNR